MISAEQIFDAVDRFSVEVHRRDAIRAKRRKIAEIENECGSCSCWMTRSCKPEKERGQFKSMGSCRCGDFSMLQHWVDYVKKLRGELDDLIAQHAVKVKGEPDV